MKSNSDVNLAAGKTWMKTHDYMDVIVMGFWKNHELGRLESVVGMSQKMCLMGLPFLLEIQIIRTSKEDDAVEVNPWTGYYEG